MTTLAWLATWAHHSCVILMLVLANVVPVRSDDVIPGVGVNWGVLASHPLPSDIVVQLLKDNGIKRVKLFDADSRTVRALAGSGIEVMVAIPNNQLQYMADSYDHALDWVRQNVSRYISDHGVDIRYVAVGNEPFLTSYNNAYLNSTFPTLQYIQRALEKEGHGDKVKATIPFNADVYESTTDMPSDGQFRADIHDLMLQIVKFLHDKNLPFTVNIYPFLSLYQNINFPVGFAFLDDDSRQFQDQGLTYTNVFDANYDTLVWSLKKAGVPDLKILVGEVGWPTDSHIFANVTLAKRFYDGLMKKLGANKGTPIRPGRLDVYLFSLFDENQKSVLPGDFERHWGIFRYDGQPKFAMDLSGKGHDKMPIGAKGVEYLPNQWCVLSPDVTNSSFIPAAQEYACQRADCTSLVYGSSCSGMDIVGNASYAFNMYYQVMGQDIEACDFDGLGTRVTQNPSRGNCLFPVQIESSAAGARHKLACGTSSIMAGVFFTLLAVM